MKTFGKCIKLNDFKTNDFFLSIKEKQNQNPLNFLFEYYFQRQKSIQRQK